MINNDTIIVTDSSCDLSDEIINEYNIKMISLRLITSTHEYKDRVDIGQEEVYKILESEIPTTSLPLPEDLSTLYEEIYTQGYKNILHISLSSGLSGTYNMVNIVARDFSDKLNITVVDTKTLSAGLGALVFYAAKALKSGMSIEDIVKNIHLLREQQSGLFIVRTLEYLRKGGRIGLVEGMVGSLLQIKPIIYVNSDGIYETIAKARGFNKAKIAMLEYVKDRYKKSQINITVVHGLALEEANLIANIVKENLNINELNIVPVSPVLGIHTGPGLLGIITTPTLK